VAAITLVFSTLEDGKQPWVLYENGTFVAAEDMRDLDRVALIAAARGKLDGQCTSVGSSGADFSYRVWGEKIAEGFIGLTTHGGCGEVFTVDIAGEERPRASHVYLGLDARRRKDVDITWKVVVATSADKKEE
jgi:hypothetical protein